MSTLILNIPEFNRLAAQKPVRVSTEEPLLAPVLNFDVNGDPIEHGPAINGFPTEDSANSREADYSGQATTNAGAGEPLVAPVLNFAADNARPAKVVPKPTGYERLTADGKEAPMLAPVMEF